MTTTNALADALLVELEAQRHAAGWTLEALGNELGLSERTMQRYLTQHKRDIPARILLGVCEAIGVPLRDIVAGAERRLERQNAAGGGEEVG